MDAPAKSVEKLFAAGNASCHLCGHFGTSRCNCGETPPLRCDDFLSWTEMWERETAAIQRAQRATYIVAGIVTALAVLVILLPSLIG